MAKKKESDPVYNVGEYSPPVVSDNNPDGYSNLPDDRLEGENRQFSFTEKVAKGESPEAPDVNVNTANGVAKSRGQGKNCQYNWGEGTSGIWNKNRDWKGTNLTGM